MPQSNVIFAFLFIGFVVWITMRGELATYAGFLLGTAKGAPETAAALPSGNNTASTGTGSGGISAQEVAQVAQVAMMMA